MKKLTILLPLLVCTNLAVANDFAECKQFFAGNRPPTWTEKSMRPRALCYQSFAILHSGTSKTPIYVAQRLSRASVSPQIERAGAKFFADARLPASERSELSDYERSGYDRGHMAPAGDMPDATSMAQSFSLANMVPQNPTNNRKTWAGIEKATRSYAMRAQGDIFVLSGPVFAKPAPTIGANKVWVPQHLFKLVYDPATGKRWAYWIENSGTAKAEKPITYEELRQRVGFDLMPAVK